VIDANDLAARQVIGARVRLYTDGATPDAAQRPARKAMDAAASIAGVAGEMPDALPALHRPDVTPAEFRDPRGSAGVTLGFATTATRSP
jgi:hypothetical protein